MDAAVGGRLVGERVDAPRTVTSICLRKVCIDG